MRRAKIVCTMGPAVESPEKAAELIAAGMNVARLNLSHGGYEEHQNRLDLVRKAAADAGKPVAILVDLQGPKIRLGRFADGPHDLNRGDRFIITTDEISGTKERVGTTYKGLPGDCKKGDRILIDDGKVTVEVVEVKGNDVITTVIEPGAVSNNKGINLPGVAVSVPAMSEKDREDLRWGLNAGADFIALSFVRSAKDIEDVHQIMDQVGKRLPVIAKIEKPQATNSRPTRAEATDCANAVLDGADALMLSGETSVGSFAIEAVQTMARIIEKTEKEALHLIPALQHNPRTKGGAITKAATEVGITVGAKYLAAFTKSGDSARRMSRLRCSIPILALTPDAATFNQMSLSWGVEPILTPLVTTTDEMVKQVDAILLESKRVSRGEEILIVAGSPPGIPGSTNAMRVHRIGDAVGGAAPAYR